MNVIKVLQAILLKTREIEKTADKESASIGVAGPLTETDILARQKEVSAQQNLIATYQSEWQQHTEALTQTLPTLQDTEKDALLKNIALLNGNFYTEKNRVIKKLNVLTEQLNDNLSAYTRFHNTTLTHLKEAEEKFATLKKHIEKPPKNQKKVNSLQKDLQFQITALEKFKATLKQNPSQLSYFTQSLADHKRLTQLEQDLLTLKNHIDQTSQTQSKTSLHSAQIERKQTLTALKKFIDNLKTKPLNPTTLAKKNKHHFEHAWQQAFHHAQKYLKTLPTQLFSPEVKQREQADTEAYLQNLTALQETFHQEWLQKSEDIARKFEDNLKKRTEICSSLTAAQNLPATQGEKAFIIYKNALISWRKAYPIPYAQKQDLENRFETLTSTLREKFIDVFNNLEAQQNSTAQKREDLIKALIALSQDLNSPKDITHAEKKFNEIHTQWKQLKSNLDVNYYLHKVFKKELSHFFTKRKKFLAEFTAEQKKENLNKKRKLIEQINDLSTTSHAWSKVKPQALKLMHLWKKTSPAPKKESVELWEQFQTAFNTLFERNHEGNTNNLIKKQKLLASLIDILKPLYPEVLEPTPSSKEEITSPPPQEKPTPPPEPTPSSKEENTSPPPQEKSTPPPEPTPPSKEEITSPPPQEKSTQTPTDFKHLIQTMQNIDKLQYEWKQIGPVSQEHKTIENDFHDLIKRFNTHQQTNIAMLNKVQNETIAAKRKLLNTLEDLIHFQSSSSHTSSESKVEKTDPSSKPNEPSDNMASQSIKELQAKWKSLPPTPREYYQKLDIPYRKLLDKYNYIKKQHHAHSKDDYNHEKVLEEKRALLIRFAILTNQEKVLAKELAYNIRDLAVKKIKFIMELNQKYRNPLKNETRVAELNVIKENWNQLPSSATSEQDKKLYELFKMLRNTHSKY
ncbi:hypothetical protein COTS27_01202 [Spirochaetota bacterium]|nr:hypothetical protein COTS27_01202 [Spirochaetota bacterium]